MSQPPITLEDLVGEHTLYAVDCPRDDHKHAAQIRFQLGRVTYVATEDPCDDYRSYMQDIRVSAERCADAARLPKPARVIGRMRTRDEYGGTSHVLQLLNARTGAVVVEVGTDNTDDYYPCWVASYQPENL